MAIRSTSDLLYTVIARLPLLLVLAGVVWVICTGLLGLETYSFGTEYFVGNHETSNALPTLGQSSSQEIVAAIESGDLEQMTAALDGAAADQAALQGQATVTAAPGGLSA